MTYVSRHTVWLHANRPIHGRGRHHRRPVQTPHAVRHGCNLIRNHLKRRSFLVASSSPPWLNLYFCCSATKIKEKYNVRSADIHGSKSVGFHHICLAPWERWRRTNVPTTERAYSRSNATAVATPHQSHSRQLPLKGKPWFTLRL